MIVKAQAITLRVAGFSRTSNIVTWLTADHGRVVTLVKGALRPRSMFLGQYDLFYTCELLFYARTRSGLHIIRECSPLNPRPALRRDWRAACAASYVADIVGSVASAGDPQPALYQLVSDTLDFMCVDSVRPETVFWFETRLLSEIGLAPRLDRCVGCRSDVPPNAALAFDHTRGGVLCGRCARDGSPRNRLRPDILAILRRWQAAGTPQAAAAVRCSRQQLLEFYRILGTFIVYHLESRPTARRIAFRMLADRRHRTEFTKAGIPKIKGTYNARKTNDRSAGILGRSGGMRRGEAGV